MTKGKHVAANSRRHTNRQKSKTLTLIIAVALLAAVMISGTIAWLEASSDLVSNALKPANVTNEVTEVIDGNYKKSVKITNTANIPTFIRVAVVANTIDEDGNITGALDVSDKLKADADNWLKIGDYYYYTKPVPKGGLTEELLSGDIDLTGNQVVIVSENIQADPAKAATEAWGVKIESGVITGAA